MNGAKLKGKIVEAGMNQRSLAKALSLSTNTINRKINGAAAFTTDEAIKICDLLSITDEREKCDIFLR